MNYFVLIVHNIYSIRIEGPFETAALRDAAAYKEYTDADTVDVYYALDIRSKKAVATRYEDSFFSNFNHPEEISPSMI